MYFFFFLPCRSKYSFQSQGRSAEAASKETREPRIDSTVSYLVAYVVCHIHDIKLFCCNCICLEKKCWTEPKSIDSILTSFVEDRLATLKNVIKEPELDGWNLYLGNVSSLSDQHPAWSSYFFLVAFGFFGVHYFGKIVGDLSAKLGYLGQGIGGTTLKKREMKLLPFPGFILFSSLTLPRSWNNHHFV